MYTYNSLIEAEGVINSMLSKGWTFCGSDNMPRVAGINQLWFIRDREVSE